MHFFFKILLFSACSHLLWCCLLSVLFPAPQTELTAPFLLKCLPSHSHFAVFSGKIKSWLSKTMMWNSCCHQCFCHLQSSHISYGYSDYQSHKFVAGKTDSGVFGWNCPGSFLLLNVNWLLVCLKMTLSCPRIPPLLESVFVGSFQSTVLHMCNQTPPFQ